MTSNTLPHIIFVQPFTVNAQLAEKCQGRVVVLDVAFNAGGPQGKGTPEEQFQATTEAFINALGDRLVVWVDHHPHQKWDEYRKDRRFKFFTKEKAPACPKVITPAMVRKAGSYDTIVAHGDFDGVMSAIMWILEGQKPYRLAVQDSIVADARIPGKKLSKFAQRIEQAMKANPADDSIRYTIVMEQVSSYRVDQAQKQYKEKESETNRLKELFVLNGIVAFIDATDAKEFDLTQLSLHGQQKVTGAQVSVILVKNPGDKKLKQLSVAGPEGWDFVKMFELTGGMKNRVVLSADRLKEAIQKINATVGVEISQ